MTRGRLTATARMTVAVLGALTAATTLPTGSAQAASSIPTHQFGYDNRMTWRSQLYITWASDTAGRGRYVSGNIVGGSNRSIGIPRDAYDIDVRFYKSDLFGGKGGVTHRETFREITNDMCMISWGSLLEAWASIEQRGCWD